MRKPAEIKEAFANRDELSKFSSFFLVGIGGAGMSGVAKMLQRRGFSVRGTDSTASSTTAELETGGIQVKIGHSGEGIRREDAVVLSDAIDLSTSPEVARARELGCQLFRRSQVLGWLLKGKKVIAVTGTHGKTTTTGMIGAGLRAAGMDPTIVVGANVPEFGGCVVEGPGEWAVVEACEAYDSFHDIDPQIVVLTNLELDHVDFHGTWENLRESVIRFVRKLPRGGVLVWCCADPGATEVAKEFGLNESVDLAGYGTMDLDLELAPEHVNWKELAVPGEHNLLNAAAALVAVRETGADVLTSWTGISQFQGAERRLQVLREAPIMVIDDYAHHPAEIRASLQAIRERYLGEAPTPTPLPQTRTIPRDGARRLIVVYQPHLYSRTAGMIPEFAGALSLADEVVLTDIYPAREAPMAGVSSARIAELVSKPVRYVPSRHLLPIVVAHMASPGDVVVGMGAGSIADFAPALLRELDRARNPLSPPGERGQGVRDSSSAPRGPLRIAVIYGGDSAEREVSLHSGLAVKEALEAKGHEAKLYDITELLLSRGDLSAFVGHNRPDLAFLAVHGTNAEDGAIQGFFELLHIPYTGSSVQSSAIAMDKRLTKQILGASGIRVPKGITLNKRALESKETLKRELLDRGLAVPLIVKPNAQGSTVGLSFVEQEEDLWPALQKALQYDESALIEEWVKGVEISVPVLGDRALPAVEIAPRTGQYDFASKYLPGATEEIIPARIQPEEEARARDIAVRCHSALGCEGATRTDMILRDGELYVLEINTLPGLTGTSLLPNSARAAGIEFEELVEWIVQDAVRRHAAKA